MCGIIGYVGSRQASEILLEGLHRLEYRGYDSAGVAVFDGLTLNNPASGYQFQVTITGLVPVLTDTFTVTNSTSGSGTYVSSPPPMTSRGTSGMAARSTVTPVSTCRRACRSCNPSSASWGSC